jgi:hypothetical protein
VRFLGLTSQFCVPLMRESGAMHLQKSRCPLRPFHQRNGVRTLGLLAATAPLAILLIGAGAAQAANIAWVSFHPGDTAPGAGAAGAGAVEAPDRGYTDMLKSAGHLVTRFVTSDTPNVPTLNSFNLVIISRSVNSAHYELDAESAAWNGILAPTMLLSGYTLRSNRLGFTTGTTIPDTGGAIKLTAANPSHPIFAGIALDGSNTMVSDYTTGLPTFNGVDQRGISVNTDAIVTGGTVLATVGTATDPAVGGMIIGEFPAGTTMANSPPDTLGGKRLVFLTGGRETAGVSTETAGVFDLAPAGRTLFLNAVTYLAGSAPPVQPGDVNLDGQTNLADYTIIKTNFFRTSGATRALGDLTADGRVDLADFTLWRNNAPLSEVAGLPIPEPGTAALAALALAVFGARRRGAWRRAVLR